MKLAASRRGAAFRLLHHIRSVSVHPTLNAQPDPKAFISASGRLSATFDILRRIRAMRERALVFIEHRQMQYRFIELVKSEFGLDRVDLINGSTPIPQRLAIVNRFQRHLEQDSGFDLLVLGPKAAGTGLTLTAATHVIHLSRWWNPAVEEQCNDRVHRLGQAKPVTVHVPMAIHPVYREQSFDLLLQSLMQRKRRLAQSALWPMGDTDGDAAQLQASLAREGNEISSGNPVVEAMNATFQRDGIELAQPEPDGSWRYS
ncbi:helicase-related protein [Marivita sp.]|uniref:helicase-related protein n=1 Tax=Marivita sp. TaxID=2003365 RepID=UPI003F72184D